MGKKRRDVKPKPPVRSIKISSKNRKRMLKEGLKTYFKEFKHARIPRQYWKDYMWASIKVLGIEYTSLVDGSASNISYLRQEVELEKIISGEIYGKRGCIAVLGENFSECPTRVGYGIMTQSMSRGHSGMSYFIDTLPIKINPLRVSENIDTHDVVLLRGIHTDDPPDRRVLIRDLLKNRLHDSLKIIVVNGTDPFEFVIRGIGIRPNIVLFYPSSCKEGVVGKTKEH